VVQPQAVMLLLIGPSLIVAAMNDIARALAGDDWTGMPYAECVVGDASRASLRLAREVMLSGRECVTRAQSEFRHRPVEITGVPVYERGRRIGVAIAVVPVAERRSEPIRLAPRGLRGRPGRHVQRGLPATH